MNLALLTVGQALFHGSGHGTHLLFSLWKLGRGPVAAGNPECNLHTSVGYIVGCQFDSEGKSYGLNEYHCHRSGLRNDRESR